MDNQAESYRPRNLHKGALAARKGLDRVTDGNGPLLFEYRPGKPAKRNTFVRLTVMATFADFDSVVAFCIFLLGTLLTFFPTGFPASISVSLVG
jgi:hypothetical protein